MANIQVESLHATVARALRDAFGWKGNRDFRERKKIIVDVVTNTILHGWTPGLGPGDLEYHVCTPGQLLGARQREKSEQPAYLLNDRSQRGKRSPQKA